MAGPVAARSLIAGRSVVLRGQLDLYWYARRHVRSSLLVEVDLREVGEPRAILLRECVIRREGCLGRDEAHDASQVALVTVDANPGARARWKLRAQRLRDVDAGI